MSKGKIVPNLGPFFRCYLVGGHPSVILVKLHKTLFLAEHFVITGMTYAWYNAKLGPQIVGTLTSRKVQGVEFIKVLVNNFGIVKSSNWFSFQPKLLLELCHFLQSKFVITGMTFTWYNAKKSSRCGIYKVWVNNSKIVTFYIKNRNIFFQRDLWVIKHSVNWWIELCHFL